MKVENQKFKNRKVMKTKSLLFFLVGVCCTACTVSTNSLPNAQGYAGDVLVVMSENYWKGALGDSVRHYLTEPVMGLPAPEATFSLTHHIELTNFMKRFRNILIVNVDPGFEMVKWGYKTDVHAKFQTIFNFEAPSADSAIACLYKNKDLIVARFLLKDREATIADYKRNMAKPVVDKLCEKYQVDIVIPNPYILDMEREDFVWIAREEGERQWGILMWKEPYTSKTQLDTDKLIAKMNVMTRKYVPGKNAGSFMADEPTVPPIVKRFEKNGVYTVQMNGLWQMENGFMGGPYVNQIIVDIKRGQLVTAHGFVFYPNRDKRQMIRQLEAILYTMMPTEEN